jgi:hypothetical protein
MIKFYDISQFDYLATYEISIYSINNPSSNDNDYLRVVYVRTTNLEYVLNNSLSNSQRFPPLDQSIISQITLLSSFYQYEGFLGEFTFLIAPKKTIQYETLIEITFPYYFTPALTNFNYQLFCSLNDIEVTCTKH